MTETLESLIRFLDFKKKEHENFPTSVYTVDMETKEMTPIIESDGFIERIEGFQKFVKDQDTRIKELEVAVVRCAIPLEVLKAHSFGFTSGLRKSINEAIAAIHQTLSQTEGEVCDHTKWKSESFIKGVEIICPICKQTVVNNKQ